MSATVEAGSVEMVRGRVEEFSRRVTTIRESLHKVIVGQDETIDLLLTCAVPEGPAMDPEPSPWSALSGL